jgi:uncharacterized protein involved in exopolysaccharide biosynthesis
MESTDMVDQSQASETLRNALTIFYYKKGFILWTIGVCFLISAILFLLSPRLYGGQFTVLVRASDLDTSRILPGAGVYLQPKGVTMEVLANEQNLILSDKVLAEVNHRLEEKYPDFSFSSLHYAPFFLRQAVGFASRTLKSLLPAKEAKKPSIYEKNESLRKLIDPAPVVGTHTIEVQVTFYDPDILEFLQKALLSAYLGTRGQLITTGDTMNIYERDVAKSHSEWTRLANETARFQVREGIYRLDRQRAQNVDALLAVDQRIVQVESDLLELRGRLDTIDEGNVWGMSLPEAEAENNHRLVRLEKQIADLEAKRGVLLADYLESSPPVKDIDFSIAELTARYKDTLRETIQFRIADARTRLDALETEKNGLLDKLDHLETAGNRLTDLERRTELAAKAYQTFSSKLQEVKLQNLLSESSEQSLSVLRDPFVGSKPMWPNPVILLPLTLVLGLFFGATMAYISYYFEDIILQPSDLTFTGLPVLASFTDDTTGA